MTQPIGYLYYGWSFFRAAEHLVLASRRKVLCLAFGDAPATVLLAHAVELLLKSFIWHRTGEKSVAEKLGHRIQAALNEARRQGLDLALSPEEADAFAELDGLVRSQPLEARYLVTGPKSDRPVSVWLNIGRKLMDSIEVQLVPDRVANAGLSTQRHPPPNDLMLEAATYEREVALLTKQLEKELRDDAP